MDNDNSYDVIIVGARCAGASAATLMAESGLKVLLLDKAHFPSDRLSTHLLLVKGMYLLSRLGVLPRLEATGVPVADEMRFNFGQMWIDLPAKREEIGVAHVCAPRRTILDHLLVERAVEAGAEVRTGTTVRSLIVESGRVEGVVATGPAGELTARSALVVGADGPRSTVARLAGAGQTRSEASSCQMFAYWSGVDQHGPEVGLCPGHGLGVFPTHEDLTCIGVTLPADRWAEFRSDPEAMVRSAVSKHFPTVADRLGPGRLASAFRGTNDLANVVRDPAGPGWALIGDASISSDPITGLGMSDAMHGAHLLHECLAASDLHDPAQLDARLADYRARRDEAFMPMFAIAERFATFAWTEDEVPALAIAISEANTADLARLTGVTFESLVPSSS